MNATEKHWQSKRLNRRERLCNSSGDKADECDFVTEQQSLNNVFAVGSLTYTELS